MSAGSSSGAGMDGRGVLYPGRLPTFHREAPPSALHAAVRWFWVPCWDLPAGERSRQEVLPFPASNLVVEPDGVHLYGPTTGVSVRILEGRGWAVGALLLPAGLSRLHADPGALRDTSVEVEAPRLHDAVATAMGGAPHDDGPAAAAALRSAVRSLGDWLEETAIPPDPEGLIVNAMVDLIASDRSIVRVDQVAERTGTSVRRVQRLAARWIGLPPLAVVRRYRLQEAAQRLREDPGLTVARVAAELGYADQAHLATDFRTVLGFSPTGYRRSATAATGHAVSGIPRRGTDHRLSSC